MKNLFFFFSLLFFSFAHSVNEPPTPSAPTGVPTEDFFSDKVIHAYLKKLSHQYFLIYEILFYQKRIWLGSCFLKMNNQEYCLYSIETDAFNAHGSINATVSFRQIENKNNYKVSAILDLSNPLKPCLKFDSEQSIPVVIQDCFSILHPEFMLNTAKFKSTNIFQ